jgi:DNA-binding CsgD family transcriptional regulator
LRRLLDSLPHAVVVLDARRSVAYCNAAAKSAADACGLSLDGRRLQAITPALAERVDNAIRLALRGCPTIVRCERSDNVMHWLFHPYRDAGLGVDENGALGLAPAAPAPATLELFANAYGLSPAERRVLHHLVGGHAGVTGVAASTGTSVYTVRSHLRNLFQKTGTRRQSDLVRLVLSLPSPPLERTCNPALPAPT